MKLIIQRKNLYIEIEFKFREVLAALLVSPLVGTLPAGHIETMFKILS